MNTTVLTSLQIFAVSSDFAVQVQNMIPGVFTSGELRFTTLFI
jgi:hypothetical protein